MRLPFTHSELSVIRSGARVALHLLAIALVLLGVYWLSAWMEHAVTGRNETEPILPSHLMPWTEEAAEERPPLQFRQFPYYTDLTSSDGRSIEATLLARPSAEEITFRRRTDGRVFTVSLSELSAQDQALVRKFTLFEP